MFTHFISVSARVLALISVVCGELQAAAMISYTTPADTMNATPDAPRPICAVVTYLPWPFGSRAQVPRGTLDLDDDAVNATHR